MPQNMTKTVTCNCQDCQLGWWTSYVAELREILQVYNQWKMLTLVVLTCIK